MSRRLYTSRLPQLCLSSKFTLCVYIRVTTPYGKDLYVGRERGCEEVDDDEDECVMVALSVSVCNGNRGVSVTTTKFRNLLQPFHF